MESKTYPLGTLKNYKYVVVLSKHNGRILLSRHKDRTTWETQGGHIEAGESALDAAKRELYEESGAVEYDIKPLCDYWAGNFLENGEPDVSHGAAGVVFVADIHRLEAIPDSEMAEVKEFDMLPDNLTYPAITPVLFKRVAMKTLYVTDLDGTLLNTRDRINPYSIEVINSLVEKGMLFTYATARSLVSASVVTEGLSTKIPVIAYNGTFIMEPATGKILASASFTKEQTDKVIAKLREHGIYPLVYSYVDKVEKVSWVITKENEGIIRYKQSRAGDKRLRPLEDERHLYDGDIFYFTCIGEKEELVPIYEEFKNSDEYTCTFQQELYRPEYWCEIMPKEATKANAINRLKSLWNCDRVVSFGDAVNDIPMFQISDECYAVANAVDRLKDMATGVIGSNDEDAVAKWLMENAEF